VNLERTMSFHKRRPASMYAMVLICSGMISTIGIAALAAVRVQRRASQDIGDLQQARLHARSAVELALLRMSADANWRTTYPNGTWWSNLALGSGSCTIEGYDPADNDLRNDPTQTLRLVATGFQGNARYRAQVLLAPKLDALDILRCALHSVGEVRLNPGKTLRVTGGPVSTNGNLRIDGSIVGNAEMNSRSGSGTIVGVVTLPAPQKPNPASSVFDQYRALATPIGTSGSLDKLLISPASNPGGGLNPNGVYYIDSRSSDLVIKNCRINGTLVIDCGSTKVSFTNQVFIQPARSDYASIVVRGALELTHSGSDLSESAVNVNFNPQGSPYAGVWDNDKTDLYPNEIQGFVYATGDLYVANGGGVRGAVCVGGQTTIDGQFEIIYTPSLYVTPPVYFTQPGEMRVSTAGWKQISD
jgi:hypothetical protein